MIALLMLACAGEADPRFQDSWEILVLNDDLSVLDLRVSRTNTGVMKGGGVVYGDLGVRGDSAIRFGVEAPAIATSSSDEGIVVSRDEITRVPGGFQVRLQEGTPSTGFRDLRFHLSEGEIPPLETTTAVGDRSWTVRALAPAGVAKGFLRAGQSDRMISGEGLMIRRTGSAPPLLRGSSRYTVFVAGSELQMGVDQTGSSVLAWARLGELDLDCSSARIAKIDGGGVQVDFRPEEEIVVQVIPRRPLIIRDPLGRLSAFERVLLRPWLGRPVRRTQGGTAKVAAYGRLIQAPAMTVAVEYK